MYTFGWRLREVLKLQRRQLDLQAGTLTLDVGTTKNKEGRVAFLTPELKTRLAAQVERVKAWSASSAGSSLISSCMRSGPSSSQSASGTWPWSATRSRTSAGPGRRPARRPGQPGCCVTIFGGPGRATWSAVACRRPWQCELPATKPDRSSSATTSSAAAISRRPPTSSPRTPRSSRRSRPPAPGSHGPGVLLCPRRAKWSAWTVRRAKYGQSRGQKEGPRRKPRP